MFIRSRYNQLHKSMSTAEASTYQISRIHRQFKDGSQTVSEVRKYPDGTKTETLLEGVVVKSQYQKRVYHPSSAYEGAVYNMIEYSDGVVYKSYVRSFDEWPGAYDSD